MTAPTPLSLFLVGWAMMAAFQAVLWLVQRARRDAGVVDVGWAAGLGHIGRCTLLVHPQYGAQMRYVSVLTDMPLPG